MHPAVADDGRQVERLHVDVEQVIAQADDVFAFNEQLVAVFELADGVFADRLHPALDVVDLDAVVQLFEPAHEVADLFDHQVRGEVAVDVVDRVEALDPRFDAPQDALGRVHQRAGAFVADLDERQLAGLERARNFLPFCGQFDDELVELGESALQLLDLDHDLGEVLLALPRRVADVEVVDHALVEQLHLRAELGDALDRQQFLRLRFQRRPGLVDLRENGGDVVDDRRPLRGVVDLEVARDFDQHFQLGGAGGNLLSDLLGLGHRVQFADAAALGIDPLLVGQERIGPQQELDAPPGQPFRLLGDLGFEGLDQTHVDVPQVPQRDNLAAHLAQMRKRSHEVTNVLESLAADGLDDLFRFSFDAPALFGRVPLDADHLVEFVDRGDCRFADLAEHLGQVERFGLVDPEIRVEDVAGLFDQIDVEVGVGVFLLDQAEHLMALGHAADDVAVADFVQERIGVGLRDVVFADVGGLPDLQGVMFLRLAVRLEANELAVLEEGRAVADGRRRDALLDDVVFQQDVHAALPVVEDIEIVFAVGCIDPPLEEQPVQRVIERFVLAGLQVVAVGKDQPVLVGQQHAGGVNRVEPDGLPGLLVVDDVAELLLLVRPDLEQDDVADDCIVDLRVVERLVFVLDRFGEDAVTRVGAVFHLERQITADGFDEHTVLDGDVRMLARAVHVPGRAGPLEVVLRREADLVIAAVVDVREPLVGDEPLERLNVGDVLANPEDHVQMRPAHEELGEDRVLVIAVDVAEVFFEPLIGDQVQGQRVKTPVAEFVDGKHVGEIGLRLQTEVHVVAEQKPVAERHHVAGHAIVGRRDPLGSEQRGVDRAEHFLAGVVEPAEPLPQLLAVPGQPVADDFVRTAFQLNFRSRLRRGVF